MENLLYNKAPFKGLSSYDVKELFKRIETPCYVIDEAMLASNGEILKGVQERTGCKILLAQKAFSNFNTYGILSKYLAGTEASGLFEARLGAEEMPDGEVHVFCGAYKERDFDELLKYADHIVFNSVSQLEKFGKKAKDAGKSIGIRINPECSTQEGHEIYDPCAPGSRLGVTKEQWDKEMTPKLLSLLDGIHFHTLCEQNSDDLEVTMKAVEDRFGKYLHKVKWLNIGGGHHITREDYDVDRLIRIVNNVREKYDVQVYIEPGEAIALNAGYLATEVLDIVDNDIKTLILDASAACHMPDVLEMPYRPPLRNSGEWGEKRFLYRLSSYTCLAGDIIGDYSFDSEVKVGDRLYFEDMAIYSMVKNNTFNGIGLPSIYVMKEDGQCELIKEFGYEDFKMRLS